MTILSKEEIGVLPVDKRFKAFIEHAVLAPSGHNTQPWLFRINADVLELIADRRRRLAVVDPDDRELTISCGAALDHLRIAARHYGWDLQIEKCPGSSHRDVLARVSIGEAVNPSVEDRALFNAIPCRRTTRENYDDAILPEELRTKCVEIANNCGTELTLISEITERSEIADLVAEGDQIQFASKSFRRELASWVHSSRAASQDGLSGTGFGMPDLLSSIGAKVIQTFDLGKEIAAGDKEKIAEGSPLLAVLSSPKNQVSDWLATGQALSRILLTLTDSGATASYLNPPVELDKLKPRLRELVKCQGVPQLLMRFGYGPHVAPTVRRTAQDVLLS